MNVEGDRIVHGDINVLIVDDVLGNEGPEDRCAPASAINVDAGSSRSSRVIPVGAISPNEVADNHVVVHVVGRCAESRTNMRMEGDSRNTVLRELVTDDYIFRNASRAC